MSEAIRDLRRRRENREFVEVLSDARRALEAHSEGHDIPRDINVSGVMETLHYIRDGQMDEFGIWLAKIIRALKKIEPDWQPSQTF